MKNKTFLLSIIFTALGVANAITYIVLTSLKIVPVNIGPILLVILYFLVIWLPIIFEKLLKMKFNLLIVIFYQLFIIFAMVIGSTWRVFVITSVYDKIVHFGSGVLVTFIFYNVFSSTSKVKLNKFWLFFISFSVGMMVGSVWEIIEYSFDGLIAGQNSQHWQGFVGREALTDTMLDLICDCLGSIIGAVAILFIDKKNNTQKLSTSTNSELK